MSMTIAAQEARIKKQLLEHGGFLPVSFVGQLTAELECTLDQLVLALLPLAREFAVPPISRFKVGAIAIGDTGNLYFGANQEYLGVPVSQGVHAEQAALACAHLHGETGIAAFAASEKPCGHCRQFLYELAGAHHLQVMLPDGHQIQLSKLLPDAFGPEQLGLHGGLLSSSQAMTLTDSDELAQRALAAARRSYAPYTKSYCGAAVKTRDGRIFAGSYLENAAFNPALPALQAALVHLVQSGAAGGDIQEAVVVQAKNGAVDHTAVTQMVLQSCAKDARLKVIAV